MRFYSSMMNMVENYLAPVAARIGGQRHIIAIRDGFISAMPFLIVGSMMLIVANPPLTLIPTT
ncbi:hypothetical protein [Dongshaea marina]|uniref:hypothetical protein n=1 Tax=Dongshaea marina TaxID=2047966 RepID=UPI001F235401|nr:hypothetical protein [Dongshaea marina]